VAIHRQGHEIACHTFSHVRTADLDAAALAGEIEDNRRYLLGLDPSIRIENFAYPYGHPAGIGGRKADDARCIASALQLQDGHVGVANPHAQFTSECRQQLDRNIRSFLTQLVERRPAQAEAREIFVNRQGRRA
jgi:peptidoglycan/xylan/chitin deacetylase (PgdA/CDA1 family)